MHRYSSLFELYLTRLREFYRQPARIFWVYGFPTVLAFGLGLAYQSKPPEPAQVDVVDEPDSAAIARALRDFDARDRSAGRGGLILKVVPPEEAMHRLVTGKTPLVVEADPDGAESDAPLPPVRYRFDPTRPEANAARAAVDDALQQAAGRVDPVGTRDVPVTEPGSRYIDFLIPGLIGLNTMGGGLWGIGFLLVNFRIAKLLKRFMATPMSRQEFLMAILGARLTFLIPDLTILLLMGTLVFQMPIRGSLAQVVLIDAIGALAFAGIGLLVASRATTTEAVSGLMNLVMLPMWLLSGVFFPSDRFPAVVQPLIQALPLTQLISALRLTILEGAGLLQIAPALAILSAWAIVTFVLALKIFRWT